MSFTWSSEVNDGELPQPVITALIVSADKATKGFFIPRV